MDKLAKTSERCSIPIRKAISVTECLSFYKKNKSKTTSSGLVKILANFKKGFILLPEIFDVLNKLLKSDEDNATGDVQLLCKLFSGEISSYHFSTEQSRVITSDTPFCILGSTQLINAAKLISKMDHGHGLVDRLLIATPLSYRPTLTEMETAKQVIEEETMSDFNELFVRIEQTDDHIDFTFENDAKQLLRDTMDQFVSEVNEAISQNLYQELQRHYMFSTM